MRRRVSVPTFLYIYKTMCICLKKKSSSSFLLIFHSVSLSLSSLSFILFLLHQFLDWRRRWRLLNERHSARDDILMRLCTKSRDRSKKKCSRASTIQYTYKRIFYECGIFFFICGPVHAMVCAVQYKPHWEKKTASQPAKPSQAKPSSL